MAKSKTKYEASKEELIQIFDKNGMPAIEKVAPLGNGEFNAAYRVTAEGGKEYVVKVSPVEGSLVLTYENNMMQSEVFWYEQMREHTKVLIPKVYASDFSKELIPASYFIMELMEGKALWEVSFSEEEYHRVQEQKIDMLTQIHRIPASEYGYLQTGLKSTWYEAIHEMVDNLVKDCKKLGQDASNGEKLLLAIEKHETLLKNVSGCMVNFDLWDSNVLYMDGKICWIDPERSYWGDPIADFITLGKGQKTPLGEKLKEIEIYNKTAEHKIEYNQEAEIRYQVAVGYLALIEEVEKYVRYEPNEENYIRNTVDAKDMYEMAFGVLFE